MQHITTYKNKKSAQLQRFNASHKQSTTIFRVHCKHTRPLFLGIFCKTFTC